jgi:hypothetical protein
MRAKAALLATCNKMVVSYLVSLVDYMLPLTTLPAQLV